LDIFADQRRREPFLDELSPKPSDSVRAIVSMLVSNAAEIALSLHPSPISEVSAFNRMRALVSNRARLLPASIKASNRARSSALSFTTYFVTAISLPATNHPHRLVVATEIHKNAHTLNDARG